MNMKRRRVLSVSATDLWSGARRSLTILAMFTGFLALSSCSERSQELDERVTVLQKELDDTETQLQAGNQSLKAAREELARLKRSSGRSTETMAEQASARVNLPSREALEKSYTDEAKALKQRLQDKLQNYSVGTCTVRNIVVASPDYPVTSTISISLRPNGGSPFQLDVPAKADRAGKWSFPEVPELVARIEEIGRSSPQQASSRSPETSVTSTAGRAAADRTAVVRWPDSGSTSRESNSSNPAPPAGGVERQAPAGSSGPAANQTFVVRWPDSGGGAPRRNPPSASNPRETAGASQKKASSDQDVLTQF
jgi:uncharacterized small protein (DUF1192 family)